ncbi:MAG: copper chaperone PCu(A)C [Pseudomonadota bacterium]
MTNTFKALAAAALLSLSALPALAGEAKLEITDAHVLESMRMAKAGAGYVQITNTGETDEKLIGAESDLGRTVLHTTEFSDDGVARMVHLEDGIEIPAGETVTLERGGLHIMFLGLKAPFEREETYPVTLIFETAGPMTVDFSVMPRTEGSGHGNHSGHGEAKTN